MSWDIIDLESFKREMAEVSPLKRTNEDGWYTVSELAEQWGVTKRRVRDLVARGMKDGLLEVENATRVGADGRVFRVLAYRRANAPNND